MLNFVVGLIMRIYCCRCCAGSYHCFCLYSLSLFKRQWHCICALQYSSKREHPEEFELCIRRVCACILKHTGKMEVWVFVTTADLYVWTYSWLFSYPLDPECTEQWKIFSQVLWSIQVCIYVYPCWIMSRSANLVSHISCRKLHEKNDRLERSECNITSDEPYSGSLLSVHVVNSTLQGIFIDPPIGWCDHLHFAQEYIGVELSIFPCISYDIDVNPCIITSEHGLRCHVQ